MLEIQNLNVFYGAIQALDNVSITVKPGEIVAIIGSNGAGKSTLLRSISGLIRTRSGTISYNGEDITGMPPHQIVKRGLSQAPEGRRIFTNMSVHENLQLGAYLRTDKAAVEEDMQKCLKRFPRLKERINQSSGTLSGGEQQMLAISRALMASPDILLLDEPSLGLAPFLITEIFNIVKDLNADGKTVLIVEQNANRALEIADRAYVLETGVVVLEGTGKELLVDPKVKEAYLGG